MVAIFDIRSGLCPWRWRASARDCPLAWKVRLTMAELWTKLRKIWKKPRVRIVFWAAFTGMLIGVTGFAKPAEDVLRDVRWQVRSQPSKGNIVVVLQDNKTLNELDALDVTHGNDADVISQLFAAGADRVFFDRTFSVKGEKHDDEKFINVLKQNSGKVFLGATSSADGPVGNYAGKVPLKKYRDHAGVVSLLSYFHAFKLNIWYPLASGSPIGDIPSLSAKIANVQGDTEQGYYPDFSIRISSYPSLSYIDVLRGRFDPSIVRGKQILIIPAAVSFNDTHSVPGQRIAAPGGYFAAIGAETLERGIPRDLGWLPPFLLVLAVIISGIGRGRVLDVYRFAGLIVALGAIPFVLDSMGIGVEIFPGLVVTLVAVVRMRNLDRVEVAGETNAGSGLPSVQALRNSDQLTPHILVALKIRNYGAIIGSFAEHVEAQLANEIVRRIRISDEGVVVYHEGGMFVWLSNIRSTFDLFENLEGLHRIVQNGIQVGGLDIDLSFNCGVDSEFDRPLSSRIASAMQSAEEAVRNDELVYQHDSRKHEAQWEISLLTSLDRAIDNGEVWVAYQPKLDVRSNRICGAEALVRWTHPERGPISPEKFIRIAEEFHRIERITRYVVNEAVKATVKLCELGHDLTMSVNISAQLLRNPGLPGMIADILAEHGLPSDRLILEITETDRLDRSSRTFQMLQRLVKSGLRLSIDDFGTGNATIDYLRYLPASEVKIDKVFVQSMEDNKEDLLLVQSIIEMAHSLDRTVVAEGVETANVLEILKRLHCDVIQGYYLSRPVPFQDLIELIARPKVLRLG
ncbi:EAL domain-containing protein [Novosphingobium mangrovi (ex Huang et al. 2023)]|uniref:EAL domain-containing protein n=1 Tax=Novosphingobium mangrovi (ex Huang et al. 2023) TaxID=2976432 RepID=A0ABT2I5A4_9SPHN|nr:EAL domain-containing protein [Novosphingobium mangrovi (ex Huang et al. 2023)]MCT2399986.1 EAL domain-containing protein [Novosphingobium mangrovi (ex Huang et al. 2023)]